jgi:hypothetical protein
MKNTEKHSLAVKNIALFICGRVNLFLLSFLSFIFLCLYFLFILFYFWLENLFRCNNAMIQRVFFSLMSLITLLLFQSVTLL